MIIASVPPAMCIVFSPLINSKFQAKEEKSGDNKLPFKIELEKLKPNMQNISYNFLFAYFYKSSHVCKRVALIFSHSCHLLYI